ncbi:restriction endonuclease subunit S [Campylobacter coli]|uniref:restriction endonuclease subunit S n=1 Tax=Campylobacter coli TaxID=195 RepID=UPI0005CA9F27|nr:restriction endonuclease subunit S [Campylobacter coli]
MQNNTMTNLPQGWEVKKLGDIVKLKNGFAFKSNLFCDIGIPIIRIKNIQNDDLKGARLYIDKLELYFDELLKTNTDLNLLCNKWGFK